MKQLFNQLIDAILISITSRIPIGRILDYLQVGKLIEARELKGHARLITHKVFRK